MLIACIKQTKHFVNGFFTCRARGRFYTGAFDAVQRTIFSLVHFSFVEAINFGNLVPHFAHFSIANPPRLAKPCFTCL